MNIFISFIVSLILSIISLVLLLKSKNNFAYFFIAIFLLLAMVFITFLSV
jgi:hypothetical protein